MPMLSGCKDKKQDPGQVDDATASRARGAVERNIRSRVSSRDAQFRGVQVYAQALPGHWAVCGQVSPFAEDANIFVPFVSVVTLANEKGHAVERFEQSIGTTTAEANRVYIALVGNCYDKGGPVSGPFQSITPLPPLPDTVTEPNHPIVSARPVPAQIAAGQTRPQAPPAASAPSLSEQALPPSAETPASGRVAMRQNANLHAAPHGPPVRVVPQGTEMHVFAQAPGGWYEVGDTAPWGWVHESMLDRH
ncbi:MAG: SH3 domain-containing protein [Janthinobacterium lividum]